MNLPFPIRIPSYSSAQEKTQKLALLGGAIYSIYAIIFLLTLNPPTDQPLLFFMGYSIAQLYITVYFPLKFLKILYMKGYIPKTPHHTRKSKLNRWRFIYLLPATFEGLINIYATPLLLYNIFLILYLIIQTKRSTEINPEDITADDVIISENDDSKN